MNIGRRTFLAGSVLTAAAYGAESGSETWTFDNLDRLGGHSVTILGEPKVFDAGPGRGKATQFDGVNDALTVAVHPLAGATQFTWEAIFRPDADGKTEQRFLHFQTREEDTRMLFETRLLEGKWCLDSYVQSGRTGLALMDKTKLHTTGEWHHVATVYDGKEMRNYVDGVLQGSGAVSLQPQGPGDTSIGMRFNQKYYFKGALQSMRMTRRALLPAEFLRA